MKNNVKVLEFPKPKIPEPSKPKVQRSKRPVVPETHFPQVPIDTLINEVNEAYQINGCDMFAEIYHQGSIVITNIYFKGLEINSLGCLELCHDENITKPTSVSIIPSTIKSIVRNLDGYVFYKGGEPRFIVDTKYCVIAIYIAD